MKEIVYLNGSLVPRSKALISVSDHGFLYGYGLFQTMRAYNGKLFLLDRHVKRLRDAADIIGMGKKLAGLDLEQVCRDTLAANKLNSARVRLTVTNGEGAALPWVDGSGAPTVVVTAVPYTPFSEKKYNEGFKAGVASVRRSRQSVVSSMKSINYLLNVMARMETAANGMDEALLLNDGGFIAEGGSGNVFFVKGSRLVTSTVDSGIIPGVTREVIIEMAPGMGIGVTEENITLADLTRFDEAFMTNALIEVMPLVAVRDEAGREITIGNGKPGVITRKLMAAYKQRVAAATGTQ